MTKNIISSPDCLSIDRLTEILTSAGLLHEAQIVDLAYMPVGQGLLGDSIRFNISYDREQAGAPASLVGKFPVSDSAARENSRISGIYLNEVNFYREIAPTVKIGAPRTYYADIDTATMEFGLLMEDMAPARGGNQLVPATEGEVFLAIDQAAALHGPVWNAPYLKASDWLNSAASFTAQIIPRIGDIMTIFHERYDDVLEPEYMAICDRYASVMGDFALREPPVWTAVHKDYRLDNMLFDAKAGETPLAVLDWQTVARDSGPLDIAYFVGLCVSTEMRQQHEREYFHYYIDRLKFYGVHDVDTNQLWREYRITAHHGVFTAILGSCLAKRTPRGDEMFMTMARGSCAQMRDLESFSVV